MEACKMADHHILLGEVEEGMDIHQHHLEEALVVVASLVAYHHQHHHNNQQMEVVGAYLPVVGTDMEVALEVALEEPYHHHRNNQLMVEEEVGACMKVVHIQQKVVVLDKDTVVVVVADNMVEDIFSYNGEHRLVDKLVEVLVVPDILVDQGDPRIPLVPEVPCILVDLEFQGILEVPSYPEDLALVVAEVADSTGVELVDIHHRTRLG